MPACETLERQMGLENITHCYLKHRQRMVWGYVYILECQNGEWCGSHPELIRMRDPDNRIKSDVNQFFFRLNELS